MPGDTAEHFRGARLQFVAKAGFTISRSANAMRCKVDARLEIDPIPA